MFSVQFKDMLLYDVCVITSLGGRRCMQDCPVIIEQGFVVHTDIEQLNSAGKLCNG